MSVTQRIAEIENEIARTQKNKATEAHLGILKAKIAKLKREQLDGAKGGGGAKGEGFAVTKSGDARVGLVGFPSVGKSTILTKLTDAFSEVASYEFTTLTCIPGVVRHKGAKIQLLDLPGIIEGAKDGKGRGKQVIAVAKTCGLILLVLDAIKPITDKIIIENELEGFGIRLNKEPPNIDIKKKEKGGIIISRACQCDLQDDTIKSILKEYKLLNVDVNLKCNASMEQLIDVIEGNRAYIPCLYVLNKIDQLTIEELNIIDRIPHYVPICADKQWNLDELVETIWEYLDLLRIYTKPRGMEPDYNAPIIIPKKYSKVADLCKKIHKTLLNEFKHAVIWGTSVKFNPQIVGKEHQLDDEDVVQIIKK